MGAVAILLLYALLILRGYWIAMHVRDRFLSLTVAGITTLTALQVFFNIGVVTNLLPSTGISLRFQLRRYGPFDPAGGNGHHSGRLPPVLGGLPVMRPGYKTRTRRGRRPRRTPLRYMDSCSEVIKL